MTDDARAEPIRRAIVTVTGTELPLGRAAITDDAGRFAITKLPAGRYTLTASKPPFIAAQFGARRPGRPGTSITLAAHQELTGLVVKMARGAVITGAIRDAQGQPAAAMQVSVIPAPASSLDATLTTPITVTTDDRGVYRLFGLRPGDYYVFAAPARSSVAGEIKAASSAELDAAFRELQSARASGPGAGAGPRPPLRPADSPRPASPTVGFAPVFYPGTAIGSDAARVTVAAGEERSNVDFSIDLVPLSTIEGTVVNPGGPLPAVGLSINAAGPKYRASLTLLVTSGTPTLTQPPNADGAFKYTSVPPGRYTILARTGAGRAGGGGAGGGGGGSATLGPLPVGAASAATLWAAAEVVVNGENTSGVALTLQPAMRMTGRVQFDAARLTPPQDLAGVRITLAAPNTGAGGVINGTAIGTFVPPPGVVHADGTFELLGILPGTYRLSATVPSASGWTLQSAMAGGRDVLDVPLEFAAGTNMGDVVITLSDTQTELTGVLQGPGGQPDSGFYVVVFPADPSIWTSARRVQSTRPGSDGRFFFRDLPPGSYLMAAATDVEPGDLAAPKFLEELARAALPVTLGKGEQKRQDLRIAR